VPRQLAGPLRRHAAVGTATVLAHGRPVAHIRLLLARALPAVSGLTVAGRFIARPLTLLIIAVLLGVLGALVAWAVARRRRARAAGGESEAA
jgi:hypothetical protein